MSHWRDGVVVCVLAALAAPAQWRVQYLHDEDKSSLPLRQIHFPSRQRGMAIGSILTGDRAKHVALVTSDAGNQWSTVALAEEPISVFCLDETACWLVTSGGIWFSTESGRSWTRLAKEKQLGKVWFVSRERGWAIGARKKAIETRDGGRSWTPVAAAQTLNTSADRTVFHEITFFTPKAGIITGRSEPRPRPSDLPIWMETEPEQRKERPTLTVALETRDGGETWTASSSSMFGRMTRVAGDAGRGSALALIEFDRYFTWPSEVYRMNLRGGGTERRGDNRVLRRKDFAVTDIAVLSGGEAYAAGYEPLGTLARTPVPGRVRVMRSSNMADWADMEVDYRATAHRVSLSAAPGGDLYLATDTGMILRLAR